MAGAKFADLRLLTDGITITARGFRRVGVIEPCRGRGLFRQLMQHLVASAESDGVSLLLLYTETTALYEQFGFVGVPQHAFTGLAPAATAAVPARRLDPSKDRSDIDRLMAMRTPLSRRVALTNAPALMVDALAADPALELAYLAEDDALLVYERDDDALTLVDVVATAMPNMARIVGALPQPIRRITTLFPPDRLEWEGAPVPDDTGLMARGPLPPALRRPFRLPPTTEF